LIVGSIPTRAIELAKWWNGRHTTLRTSRLHGVGVRLSPWSLRSGLELGFQHGLIRRPTPVQIRPPLMRGEGTGARGEQGCFSSLAPHSSPLVWAAGPTGRRRLCTPEMRVRLPRGPLTEGSRIWLAGPLCYSGSPTEIRVRLPCLPLAAPVVKRTIMPRFERGVPGSTPGRGTDSPVVEWPRRLPDTEEIGGSIPPGTTSEDTRYETRDARKSRLTPLVSRVSCTVSDLTDGLPELATGLAWNASEPQGLVGSTPTPSAVSVV
jgi:hypothetical protein